MPKGQSETAPPTNGDVLLTRAQILGFEDLRRERVDMQEFWGGDVYVRELTAHERAGFASLLLTGNEGSANLSSMPPNIYGQVVAWATTHQDGKRMFTDADGQSLALKSGRAVQKLIDVIFALSDMGSEGNKVAKGDSSSTTDAGSPTG